ncbi:hypothetical protein [Christiangramia sp.]|uniref:hypothetical protein n=1 Tax=Christiangramia sp. TaxID=1931228 RepID=UPI00260DFC2B|nr:hypothetical protein [Christiangramia sp.]
MEEILYREDSSDEFEKYVYIGTAYPEDLGMSPPQYQSLIEWQELARSDDYAEILVNLLYCEYIYYESPETFVDNFGKEFYEIFKKSHKKMGVAKWFWGIDLPIFSELDLREKEIKESTYFENGENKHIQFTDGSEVKVVDEMEGFSGGFYVTEEEYPQLLKDIEAIRKILNE